MSNRAFTRTIKFLGQTTSKSAIIPKRYSYTTISPIYPTYRRRPRPNIPLTLLAFSATTAITGCTLIINQAQAEPKVKPKSDDNDSKNLRKPIAIPLTRWSVADAAERVIPSVVNIRHVITRKHLSSFLFDPEVVEVSCGSGFFISEDGHILTNSHVVSTEAHGNTSSEAESLLQVSLSTGETYIARIVAADPESDIAIIKINSDRSVPVAKLGDSDNVRPGDFVVAVGSPLTLSNSCSFGIVSTIQRDLAWGTGDSSPGLTYLQLDVAINQGSSGGPCVTLDGEVIGICSMKIAGDAEGIAFAIPIKYAQKVVEDLQTHGYVRRPFLGLTLISVTPDLFEDIRKDSSYRPPLWLEREMRNMNSAKSVGLMVHSIIKGGPGDRAGLKAGDVVVAVNNTQTTTTSEFLAALSFQVHKNCELLVKRAKTGYLDHVTIRPEVLRTNRKQK